MLSNRSQELLGRNVSYAFAPETLAREELGIDPKRWEFGLGSRAHLVPALCRRDTHSSDPLRLRRWLAVLSSLLLGILGLLIVGVRITLTQDHPCSRAPPI